MKAPMNADSTPIAADTSKMLDRERMDSLTRSIIGAAHRVSTRLGVGFLEKVYENALGIEVRKIPYRLEQQRPVLVEYDGEVVGQYVPDLVIEDRVIVEVKAVECLERTHKQQCINYLRATGYRVCLLLNFGRPSLEVRRIVHRF